MKSRLLKKILNDTKYTVADYGKYISVGSPMCHDLIKLDKETLNVSYALDTFREGRKALKHEELTFIWDTLHELIESGEIKEIIEGDDELQKPLPVWTFEDGKLINSWTDEYGWPNTTFDGKMMHDNTYFKNKKEAIEKGIKEYSYMLKWAEESKIEKQKDLEKIEERISTAKGYINNLKKINSQ